MFHRFRLELKPPIVPFVFCLPDLSQANPDFHNENDTAIIAIRHFRDLEQIRPRPRLNVACNQIFNRLFFYFFSCKANIDTAGNGRTAGHT